MNKQVLLELKTASTSRLEILLEEVDPQKLAQLIARKVDQLVFRQEAISALRRAPAHVWKDWR